MNSSQNVYLDLHVQPRASKREVIGFHNGRLKLRVSSPPSEGQANKACIELLSEFLNVKPHHLRLISGHSSRIKRVEIYGYNADYVNQKIEQLSREKK